MVNMSSASDVAQAHSAITTPLLLPLVVGRGPAGAVRLGGRRRAENTPARSPVDAPTLIR